jgi:hypothetical protein
MTTPPTAHGSTCRRKEARFFFFEKKKQKTFARNEGDGQQRLLAVARMVMRGIRAQLSFSGVARAKLAETEQDQIIRAIDAAISRA